MVDFTGGTWRSLIDGSEVSAIPDSAIYYWLAGSFDDPWLDEVDDHEMSVFGLESSTVDGNETVSADTGDFGEADLSKLEDNLDTGFSIEFVISTTDNDIDLFGRRFSSDFRIIIGHGDNSVSGTDDSKGISFELRDDDSNTIAIQGETQINDGNLHSIVCNLHDITGSDDAEIIIDGETETLDVNGDDSLDSDEFRSLSETRFWTMNDENDFANDGSGDVVGWTIHDETLTEGTIL